MILRLSIVACTLLSGLLPHYSAAQALTSSVPEWMLASKPERSKAAYELYLKHHAGGPLKTAGTAQRLTGIYQVQRNASEQVNYEDSAVYRYSGTRGMNPKGGSMYVSNMRADMLFDTGISYLWTGTPGSYAPKSRLLKSFNAGDRPDSFIQQDWSGSSWMNIQKGSYTYTASGQERMAGTEVWDNPGGTWRPSHRTFYTYNGAGDIVSDSFQFWDNSAGAMVNVNRMLYAYDAAGRLIMMEYQTWKAADNSWVPVNRDSIGYTAGGKVESWTSRIFYAASGVWRNSFRELSYFNGAGFERAAVRQMDDGSDGWMSQDSTVHAALNAAGLPLVDSVFWNGSAGWQISSRTTYTYTPDDLLSTSLMEGVATAGGLQNLYREFYFYNASGQLTRHFSQTWNGTAWSVARTGEHRYYYETYATPAGIQSGRAAAALQGSVYPVPASGTATLALHLPSRQTVRISLYDAAGRLRYSFSEDARAGLYTKDFSVAALPAGRYVVHADAGQGAWSGTIVVLR